MIVSTAPARVGILGNPYDGYGGRALALAVTEFSASVELEPAERLEIVAHGDDEPNWDSVGELVDRVDREGYGTGPQLLAATIRTFADVMASIERPGFDRSAFRLSYRTNIPRQVGLAGSSALVVATLKCLAEFLDVEIPSAVLPSIALRVETEQLGITACLQDRVVQSLGGLVAMNFGQMTVDARYGVTYGEYRQLEAEHLPNLFLAYRSSAAEPSDGYHQVLRQRYESGDGAVRETLKTLTGLVIEGEAALRWKNADRLAELIEANTALWKQLGPIPESQLQLLEVANRGDAPATLAGSGGAIVGVYSDEDHLKALCHHLLAIDAVVVPITGPTDRDSIPSS